MDSAHPTVSNNFFTLKQTAEIFSVPVETLLEWNENNILKPTITQNGEVGYTEEQIVKFLAIRQILQNSSVSPGKVAVDLQRQPFSAKQDKDTLIRDSENSTDQNKLPLYHSESPLTSNSSEIHFNKSGNVKSYKKSGRIITLGLFSLFLIISLPLTLIFVTKQTKVTSSENTNGDGKILTTSKINGFNFLKSTSQTFQVPIGNKTASESNFEGTGITDSDSKLATQYSIIERDSATSAAEPNNQISIIPLLGQSGEIETQNKSILDSFSTNYNAIVNSASRPTLKNDESEVFDNNGNIKGDTSTPLLATTLGTTGVLQSDKPGQTINPNILLGFLSFGLLLIIFGLKNKLDYSLINSSDSPDIYPGPDSNIYQQKILEIDQKTDGTVVLFSQNGEYKVCKPELNSESDQFIERLLGFTTKDVQEVNYDILKDKKISVNAPLSKLVTRLGFVGLKRDLFFPRTSKNRVLFRRFLTQQDLDIMGLTQDEILKQLIS